MAKKATEKEDLSSKSYEELEKMATVGDVMKYIEEHK